MEHNYQTKPITMATESEVEIQLPGPEAFGEDSVSVQVNTVKAVPSSSPGLECKCDEHIHVTDTSPTMLSTPDSQPQSEHQAQLQTEMEVKMETESQIELQTPPQSPPQSGPEDLEQSTEDMSTSNCKVTTPVKDPSLHLHSPSRQSKAQTSPTLTQATSLSTTESTCTTSTPTYSNKHPKDNNNNESRFKITILNLSGISIRSIEHAEKFGSPSRRCAQNFSITASVSFTGSCDPCDMRVVSSGLCSSSGRLICESRPVIVPNGMTDGLVAVWDDSNYKSNCSSSSSTYGHGLGYSNNSQEDLEGCTSLYSTDKIIFGKKKGTILANPTARPHLYVTTRDMPSSVDMDATDSGGDDNNCNNLKHDSNDNSPMKIVDSSKHSDIMQKTTYSTAPSSITTGLDMEDEEGDGDEVDEEDESDVSHGKRNLNTPIALADSRKCVSLPIDLGHHRKKREREQHHNKHRHQDQYQYNHNRNYRESSSTSKSSLSTFSQFSRSPSRTKSTKSGPTPMTTNTNTDFHSLTVVNAPSSMETSSTPIPEILEFQVALHTHQIPNPMTSSEEEYEDLNSVRSSCPPQCGAVAHLVLFPDLLQEGKDSEKGNSKFCKGSGTRSGGSKGGKAINSKGSKDDEANDNDSGTMRADGEEEEDKDDTHAVDNRNNGLDDPQESFANERVIELPVRKPFSHLTRGISSVSGLSSRCLSAEATSVAPSKKRFVTDPEAYIDLEEDAIIRIKIEKCSESEQMTLEKEDDPLISSWNETMECCVTDKSLVDNGSNHAAENDVVKNSEDNDDHISPMVKTPVSTNNMQEVRNMLEEESLMGQVDADEQHTRHPKDSREGGGFDGDHNHKYDHNQNRDLIQDAVNLHDGQNNVTSPPQEAPPIFCRGLDLDAILSSFSGMLMHCGDEVHHLHHRGLNGGGSMDSTIYTAGTL